MHRYFHGLHISFYTGTTRETFHTNHIRTVDSETHSQHKSRATIGSPAKRHPDGVSLAGRWWSSIICILGIFRICVNLMFKRACQYVQRCLLLRLRTETLCLSILCIRVRAESLLCTKLEAMVQSFLHAPSEDTNRTGIVFSMLWVIAGHRGKLLTGSLYLILNHKKINVAQMSLIILTVGIYVRS